MWSSSKIIISVFRNSIRSYCPSVLKKLTQLIETFPPVYLPIPTYLSPCQTCTYIPFSLSNLYLHTFLPVNLASCQPVYLPKYLATCQPGFLYLIIYYYGESGRKARYSCIDEMLSGISSTDSWHLPAVRYSTRQLKLQM